MICHERNKIDEAQIEEKHRIRDVTRDVWSVNTTGAGFLEIITR